MIDRYSRREMATLWGDARRYAVWLDVELAVCRAMERRGVVPAGTVSAVESAARGKLDAVKILEIEQTTRHDVIAFLTHVESLAGPPARFLHLGMTSSDVLDSSTALLARAALDEIIADLDALLAALARRAWQQAKTPVMGRSHGIFAEPTTYGLVLASHHAEFARAKRRVVRARAEIAVGKIAGAVGNYGHLTPEIEAEALGELGLSPETVATQVVARDRHAELLSALALVGAAVERLALTVRHGQRTEVGEVEEAFGAGQKGSSAMPHKKNPILSENLTGLARLLRAYAGAGFEDIALWHERDISHSSVERVVLPDATIAADFMLRRATALVDGLVIKADAMRRNLDRAGELWASESVMLALVATGLPRQRAYEIVQRSALRAHSGEAPFRTLLAADTDLSSRLSPETLVGCFDLDHQLAHTETILARALDESHGN